MDKTLSWALGIFGIVVLAQQAVSAVIRAKKQARPDVYILDNPKEKDKSLTI